MRSRLRLAAFATAAFCAGASVCPAGEQDGQLQQQVAAAAQELETAAAAKAGVSVLDLGTGRPVVEVRSGELFIPASNQKILTSAFALARLGGQGQFTTAVYSLDGNLVVAGNGDPTIGDTLLAEADGKTIYWQLDEWAQAVRQKLGAKIGDLIVVVSGPGEPFRHPDWPQGQWGNWYAAPVASLNFNNNCFDISFSVTGGTANPEVSPVSRFIKVVNNVNVGQRQVWSASSSSDDSVLTITGTIATGTSEPTSVAANNPPMLLGWVLADRLARAGVEMGGTVRSLDHEGVDWSKAVRVAGTSTPLATVMARANKRSLNMAAECMFLNAGDGTWDGSAKLMAQTLRDSYGLDDAAFVVRDGGGLSRGNRVTPEALTSVLRQIAARNDAKVFLDSLPVSGEDGTLHRRLVEESYRQRVLAKTGYIAGVSALSGYILDGEGAPALAFSILLNDVKSTRRAKAFQDDICRMLVDHLEAQGAPAAAK